ncbi:restriction endonuclease subunit S [Limnobacter sp. MED105]|uniref:restriction endonuclease subunit S n=1 Tax=Limnobacter sp. MED105 TaxID=391597 RepID=UPI000156C25A|nr:restriction endonuclease subunit S [Limnobacter sp. MED105]EDM82799.1 hypothetical protein LMED105_16098 [Limnobacter sp. MED105]
MNRYPEYKSSGSPVFGDIPSHWEKKRLRDCIECCVNGIWGDEPDGGEDDIPVIRVADFDRPSRKVEKFETVRKVEKTQRVGRALYNGDMLIEKSGGGEQQPVGMVVSYQGPEGAVCSNFVAKMTPKENIASRFLVYLHSHLYASGVTNISIKQTTGIQNLDSTAYLSESIYVPSLGEQVAIAQYLDIETARIDTLIYEKEALIGLLDEWKQSVTEQVLTKGLSANIDFKTSDVEWLQGAEIPSQWVTKSIKHIAHMRSGETITSENIDDSGKYPVYGGNGLRGFTTEKTHDGEYLLIGRQGALCGNVHHVKGEFWATEHAVVVTLNTDIDSRWAFYMLRFMDLGQYSLAAAQPGLSVEKIVGLKLPVPSCHEQKAISDHLDKEMARLEDLINHTTKEIELLRELRAATIADAVLGRIDVRDLNTESIE